MDRLCLVDGPIAGDLRVQRGLHELGSGIDILDITAVRPAKASLAVMARVACLVLRSVVLAWPRRRALLCRPDGGPRDPLLAGMGACLAWMRCSVVAAHAMRARPDHDGLRTVQAHDLYCGVAAVLARLPNDARLVYDSHELQTHRNRRAGALRVLVEAGLELAVLQRADEVWVVNQAIADLVRRWYDMRGTLRVRPNDFFAHHPANVPPPSGRPSIVYVGKGLSGRRLELLDREPDVLGFEVHLFTLGVPLPPVFLGRHWQFGPADYERALLSLAASRRCLMWCCLDERVLSYRLAAPNKFFQALAAGIPVIASRGTYLAEVVEREGLGAVFDGENLASIAADAQGAAFAHWVGQVVRYRAALRDGRAII